MTFLSSRYLSPPEWASLYGTAIHETMLRNCIRVVCSPEETTNLLMWATQECNDLFYHVIDYRTGEFIPESWSDAGIDTLYFADEKDAIAFKLKFG
jgi:hypothetical protein